MSQPVARLRAATGADDERRARPLPIRDACPEVDELPRVSVNEPTRGSGNGADDEGVIFRDVREFMQDQALQVSMVAKHLIFLTKSLGRVRVVSGRA